MAWFLTEAKDRDPAKLDLTEAEAWDMWKEGFRFAEFNPETDVYRLSAPYRVAINLDKGTWAISQSDK